MTTKDEQIEKLMQKAPYIITDTCLLIDILIVLEKLKDNSEFKENKEEEK